MTKNHKAHYNHNADDPSDHSVSYEEIIDILSKRHDFERFGDNDIF